MNSSPVKRSPLNFFLIVYGLSIPLWIIETMIEIKGMPLDIPVTDIVAAFTPLIAAGILIYNEEGRVGMAANLLYVFRCCYNIYCFAATGTRFI